MDELTQKFFNKILAKDLSAITEGDKTFLKARVSYLTPQQKTVYAEALGSKPVEKAPAPRLEKSRSYRALQKQATELGIKAVGVSREELERSVDTATGPTTK